MKKSLILWGLAVIIFVTGVVWGAFYFAGKSQQQNDSIDQSMDHGSHESGDLEKLNSWVGQQAPDFTLYSYDNKKMTLSEQKGKRVVLFFTEGVMCYPSCWNQIAAFGQDEAFKKEDTVVFNIVVDTKNEWDTAVKKMPELTQTTILHDASKNVSREYGVLSLPSSMHKGKFPGHTYLLVDKEGIVRFVKDDSQMAVRNDELKAELAKLN